MPSQMPHDPPLPPGFALPNLVAGAELPLQGVTILAVEIVATPAKLYG